VVVVERRQRGDGEAVSVRETRPGEARHTTRRRGGSVWEGVFGWPSGGERREEAVAGRGRSRAGEDCVAGGGQVLSEALCRGVEGRGWLWLRRAGAAGSASGRQWAPVGEWMPVPGASAE
jgi:hypothetical protein